MSPEATVTIRYRESTRELPDGTRVSLRMPTYEVAPSDGVPLDGSLVLMPRMPQSVQGWDCSSEFLRERFSRWLTPPAVCLPRFGVESHGWKRAAKK